MATTVRKLCTGTTREQRSLRLGHTFKEGLGTTEPYEIDDPEYYAGTALATDFEPQQMYRCCKTRIASEVRLKRSE